MPLLSVGQAVGEFGEAAGGDQAALGGMIAGRQCPVGTGGVAAPDPPPRVLAAELVKPAVLVVGVPVRGHRCCPLELPRAAAWGTCAGP